MTALQQQLPPWLRQRLEGMLGPMSDAEWAQLLAGGDILDVPFGTVLFEAGNMADHWYVVLSGRLAVLSPPAADAAADAGEGAPTVAATATATGADLLATAGAGELLGELAVLTAQPRSATVYALRDSQLLRFGPKVLHDQLLATPERAMAMLRYLARRMGQRSLESARAPIGGNCIALLPAGPGVDLRGFAQRLARSLSAWGRCSVCGADDLHAAGGSIPQQAGSGVWIRVDTELENRAAGVEHLLLLADPLHEGWSRHVLQRADRVLVVADAEAPAQPLPLEQAWLAQRQPGSVPATLVLLQPPGRQMPRGTAAWLSHRPGLRHRHVAAGDEADLQRLARHLCGREVALALSGGGARGFAHLGVAQALHALGIPIDGLAGTSAGAMSAALIAQRLSMDELRDAARRYHEARPFGRGTLPLYALRSPVPFDAALRGPSHGLQIEDLWLPMVAVSANLTHARAQRHERGGIFEAVRASSSMPGVVPPWLWRGELLVDGGLVDNLPVGAARECIAPRVIAVDVTDVMVPRFDAALYPSPWRRLIPRLPGGHQPRAPGLLSILMHSLLLGSLAQTRVQREAADLCLRPPLQRFGVQDTQHWATIIDIGCRHAEQVLSPVRDDWRDPGVWPSRPA